MPFATSYPLQVLGSTNPKLPVEPSVFTTQFRGVFA